MSFLPKAKYIFLGLFTTFLLGGFTLGGVLGAAGGVTQMHCPCGGAPVNTNATGTYEIPCNHVGPDRDYLFFSYIIDIYRPQDGKEIIVCEDGNRIDERVDYDYGEYRMKILRQEIMLSDLF